MAATRLSKAFAWTAIGLLSLGSQTIAQTVQSSNGTTDLLQGARFIINATQAGVTNLELVPLTESFAEIQRDQFRAFSQTDRLVVVTPNNVNSLTSNDFAFISCDDSAYNNSNLNVSGTFGLASTHNPPPAAIILYSEVSMHCLYDSDGASVFNATFTTNDPRAATMVVTGASNGSVQLLPDPRLAQESGRPTSQSDAMIILYAITGIITGMFVLIIVAGAIRAHRHPERYGPRNTVGRPRQSRAKGVARAMLDTLPIVKFGDPDPEPPKRGEDVELGSTRNGMSENQTQTEPEASTSHAPASPKAMSSGEGEHASDDDSHEQAQEHDHDHDHDHDHAHAHAPARPDGTDEDGVLGCSICTEDFCRGEELRVLPCNHKFHPACVDPWLLNVSGTCPLCRINLDPEAEKRKAEEENAEGSSSSPVSDSANQPTSDATPTGSRVRSMDNLPPEEWLATARQLRDQELASGGQRAGLNLRLRKRFRIRTRRHGMDPPDLPSDVPVPVIRQVEN